MANLEQVQTWQVDKHPIDEACYELRGAGARILCFGAILFANTSSVSIRGPLSVTMGPGVESLPSPALHSSGDLRLLAPRGATMDIRNIVSETDGAATSAVRNIVFEGEGTMVFENLNASRAGAAAFSLAYSVTVTVANVHFRNCFVATDGIAGGAIYAGSDVILDSHDKPGAVKFESCSSRLRGGAIASRGAVELKGKGTYLFLNCSCTREGGGAVSSVTHVSVELQAGGSVSFRQCRTMGPVGGGAVSGKSVLLKSGRVEFSGCSSDSQEGNAVLAKSGSVIVGEDVQVQLADMRHGAGSVISARTILLPADGDLEPIDIRHTRYSMPLQESITLWDNYSKSCPAGSRFHFKKDPEGGPDELHKCVICRSGTASLAPSFATSEGKVTSPEAGMPIVLVRLSSPNSLQSLGIAALREPSKVQDDTAKTANGPHCGLSVGELDVGSQEFVATLGRCHSLNLTFQNNTLRTADGMLLAVPWHRYRAGQPLVIFRPGQERKDAKLIESAKFDVSPFGDLTPHKGYGLSLGLGHDERFVYDPADPFRACLPCHELATEHADKISCSGGTHVYSLPGYMVLHVEGNRSLQVHQCPNKDACPGSALRLTAQGRLSSHSRLCGDGYDDRTAGCVECARGHGRLPLDPFVCKACWSQSRQSQDVLNIWMTCLL